MNFGLRFMIEIWMKCKICCDDKDWGIVIIMEDNLKRSHEEENI